MNFKFLLTLFLTLSFNLHANENYGKFKNISEDGKEKLIVTSWNSGEGIKLLETSNYKKDFFNLAHHFEPQINPLFCGIASSTIVLNALNQGRADIPNSKAKVQKPEEYGGGYVEYKKFTQAEFFNSKTEKIKKKSIISLQEKDPILGYDAGVSLMHLKELLESHALKVEIFYADKGFDAGFAEFKQILKENLNQKDKYILSNYHGRSLGALTGGHISPIVAYNQAAQKIMVLDVAAHKQPWFWVEIDNFYRAMQMKDGNKERGFLLVGLP